MTEEKKFQIAEFDAQAAALAALALHEKTVFDMTTKQGEEDARKLRRASVELKGVVEKIRVELKEPHLTRGRLIDSEAKELREAIERVESNADKQIRVLEEQKEQARVARAAELAKKTAAIRSAILDAFTLQAKWAQNKPLAEVEAVIAKMKDSPADERYGDLQVEAEVAKEEALALLETELTIARQRAEQQAEIDRQKAQLEEQRKKDSEERKQRLEQEANERREREKREAAEATERRAKEDAARKAEDERLAAARAEIAQREERLRKEQAEIDEKKRIEREAEEAERRRKIDEEDKARALEALTLSRLQQAAPKMKRALELWHDIDAANLSKKTDAYIQAVDLREEALADAAPPKDHGAIGFSPSEEAHAARARSK